MRAFRKMIAARNRALRNPRKRRTAHSVQRTAKSRRRNPHATVRRARNVTINVSNPDGRGTVGREVAKALNKLKRTFGFSKVRHQVAGR